MKILHTADIHLKEYGDERWEALQDLIEIAKKEKIELFIISGDLFDKGVDAEKLKPKIRQIFSNTGFKILVIPGNHDVDCYKSGMYFGEDIVILTDINKPFEYKDIKIWGMPFENISHNEIFEKLNSLANKLTTDKKNILLYHGELLDAVFSRKDFGDEGYERYMPVKLSYFKNLNLNYVLAGHFHSNFEFWNLPNGGYFVYPGSPISITKKETGQRKVNIFEVGNPPREYLLDTPHFEEVIIKLDPFENADPVEKVKEHIEKTHPKAKILLTITGYINSKKIGMNEVQFVNKIKEITKGKCADEDLNREFRDISTILEDDLFKKFIEKLKQTHHNEEKKKQLYELAIKAMTEAKL